MMRENEKPPAGATAEGQPKAVGANGATLIAQTAVTDKADSPLAGFCCTQSCSAAYRSQAGRIWHYNGKRARVLTMLATMPGGVTQWDTLPWHTRLGGTIHALRQDGLVIETEREGDFRHARYRLVTPGCLLKQAEYREATA